MQISGRRMFQARRTADAKALRGKVPRVFKRTPARLKQSKEDDRK